MKRLFFIFFSFLMGFSYAQDLHIYYNLHKDSLWYEKNGKPVSKLELRKGKQIYLHLIEYNNYIYNSENEISYHSTQPPGFESQSNTFLGMMPTLINSLVPGGSALLPLMQAPVFGNLLSVLAPNGAAPASRGANEDLIEYEEKLQELENQKEAINSMVSELNQRINADQYIRGDLSFIKTLTTNPNIAPSLIKAMLNQYFSEALMLKEQQTFQITDIPALVEKMEGMQGLKSEISSRSKDFESNLSEFKKLHKRIKNSDHGIDALYGLMKEFENKLPEIENLNVKINARLGADSASAAFDYREGIQRIFLKYSEIQSNDFSITYSTEASTKYVIFDLKVFLRDSNAASVIVSEEDKQLFKALKLKVMTYGEYGIATSVGVQGAGFNKTPETYYVSNNVLLSEPADKYVPFVASMFNLHYQFNSTYSPAISFGVGIPLSNKEVIDNLSYMVGPSLIVGKNKNFVITGGFIFSRILRLSENLHVGDVVNLGVGTIPTRGRFEQGYFIGISYNIRS